MLGIHDFPLFVLSCILLNLTPGQDTLYIVGRTLSQGKRAGIMSALGILAGVLIHTLLAATGLSVILATSSLAFAMVKFAGAAYLVWIGIAFVMNGSDVSNRPGAMVATRRPWSIFRQGVLTNVLNPKVALFFLSLLPQFVSRQSPSAFLPFLILGLVFLFTSGLWFLVLVNAAGWLSSGLQDRTFLGGLLKKLTGALFIGLGIRLAFSQAR
jgi:threonine/homoserine/homoserine lactone efflux protein